MKHKWLALLFVALMPALFACEQIKEEENVPSVTVFDNGATDYAIVIAARGSDMEYSFGQKVEDMAGVKLDMRNDRLDETPSEILIGATNRALSLSLAEELQALASEDAFHYIIAEAGGKIAIIADNDLGYQYAADYIPATYLENGVLQIPIDCRDVQTVTWDEYHQSAYYADVLAKEEARVQREKEKEAEALKRKEEEILRYKELASQFNTADFGEREAFPTKQYNAPDVYPSASHPRVLFTENSIEQVRANLSAEENSAAYKRYISLSENSCSGIFTEISPANPYNIDYNVTAIVEAKAFRYAMTGEELYGYQAIYAAKNMLLSLNIPKGTLGDSCRAFGYVMYVASCVYDWCYDLMTEEDKTQIINGCVTLMGAQMEMGVPPTKQGALTGHGTEAQILRDWLTLAIACYDESPDIYEFVAGRILSEYVPAQNHHLAAGGHWEGSAYGIYRLHFILYTQYLFDRMTDGAYKAFSDDMHPTATTFLYYLRPDGQPFRIGDVWGETGSTFNVDHYYNMAFYAGNYYSDPILKTFAREGLNDFSRLSTSNNALSCVMVLALNDPTVGEEDPTTLPLSRLTKAPLESLFARTAWDDEDSVLVYMTMPQSFALSHAHMDCGSFQIYYKGILASDSGKYSTWGDFHHMSYTTQTISSNSILVYNPDMVKTSYNNYTYSGGQSITQARRNTPQTLSQIKNTTMYSGQKQCVSLGAVNGEIDGEYRYSYMGGDMTAAYDKETVDEVTRYMLAAVTDDADRPLVFATYDRITSDDASYRKSALIHVQEEPTITDDGFAIITNTRLNNSGKLIVQSVMTDTEYTVIGGEGKRYWLHDSNANTDDAVAKDAVEEYGWGRIEISPTDAAKSDYMLTVMYVTDATNDAAPIRATDISTDQLAGALIMNRALLFSREEKLLTEGSMFTLTGEGTIECYVAGVAAGDWTVTCGGKTTTVTVAEGENLLTFTAGAGDVTIAYETEK